MHVRTRRSGDKPKRKPRPNGKKRVSIKRRHRSAKQTVAKRTAKLPAGIVFEAGPFVVKRDVGGTPSRKYLRRAKPTAKPVVLNSYVKREFNLPVARRLTYS